MPTTTLPTTTQPTTSQPLADLTPATPSTPAPRPRRTTRRIALGAGVAGALVLIPAGIASAHVRVQPDSSVTGGYSALTFRVPDESATASTTKLVVQLPQDTPFASVSTKPVPGWTAVVTTDPLPAPVTVGGTTLTKAPHTVTWTANDPGSAIAPGQYQEFSISAGPLPAPGTIALPATQTYSDGTVVAWDQPTPAGGAEPQHPAPAFTITAKQAAAGASATSGASGASVSAAGASTAASSSSADSSSSLGVVALVVSLVGLAIAVGALVLARRGARATTRS